MFHGIKNDERAMSPHAQEMRRMLTETALKDLFESAWEKVLVGVCGDNSNARDRDIFVAVHLDPHYPATEWRFQGSLGFGGKFRNRGHLTLRVDCYPEDLTPEREETINKANKMLAELVEQALKSSSAS